MIVTFRGRPFRSIDAQGYSTEDIKEMIDDERINILTEEEAGDVTLKGSAPRPIRETLDELEA